MPSEIELRKIYEELTDEDVERLSKTDEFKKIKEEGSKEGLDKFFDTASRYVSGGVLNLVDEVIDAGNQLNSIEREVLPDFLMEKSEGSDTAKAIYEGLKEEKKRTDESKIIRDEMSSMLPDEYAPSQKEEIITDMIFFGLPFSRFGSMSRTNDILKQGKKLRSPDGLLAIAKDSAENGIVFAGVDYGLSKAYGLSDDEAIQNATMAFLVGKLGTPAVATAKGAFKAMDNLEADVTSEAGGMSSKDYQYFEKEFVDDMTKEEAFPDVRDDYFETKDIRDISEQETVPMREKLDIDERDVKGLDDADASFDKSFEVTDSPELNKMYYHYKKLEKGVDLQEGINLVYRYNKDTFKGIEPTQVSHMLSSNNKLYQGLLSDTIDELKMKLDVDGGIKIGDKEDLYQPSFVDSTKAEELAKVKASNKAARIEKAKMPKRQKFDFETTKRELDDATVEFNKLLDSSNTKALDLAEKRLTKAMREHKAIGTEGKIDGTLDDLYNTGISPSKADVIASEARIGMPIRSSLQKGKFKSLGEEHDLLTYFRKEKALGRTDVDKSIEVYENKLFEKNWRDSGNVIKTSDIVGEPYFASNKELVEKVLKSNNADIKFTDKELDIHIDGSRTAGLYNPNGNRILVKKGSDAKQTLLHELVHTVTDSHLVKETSEQYKIADRLFKETKKVLGDKYDANGYWRTDAREFMSEIFTNKKLAKDMNRDRNLWGKVIDTIAEILDTAGIKTSTATKAKINKQLNELFDYMVDNKATVKSSKQRQAINSATQDVSKYANWMADVNTGKAAKSFRDIHNATKQAFDSASRFKTVVIDEVYEATKHMKGKGREYREQMYKHLLQTDYNSIKEFTDASEASRYMSDNKNLYIKAKREIDLLAKSLKDSGAMNNIHWRGNGYAIAKKLGIDISEASKIEKLASIRAMSPSDWKFVQENRGSEAFELAMNLMARRDDMSADLFKDNKFNRIKGYSTEVFTKGANEFTYKRGAIPPETQSKVKGTTRTKPSGMSDTDFEKLGELNMMGVVLDSMGNTKLLRTVADEKYKIDKLGKSLDFGEVMGETLGASVRKQNVNHFFMNRINEVLNRDNGLFNGTGSDFINLSDKQIAILPKQLRGVVNSIHKDYIGQVLGNIEVHKRTTNQSFINAQLMVKDLVRGFKENVVLKNPVSYVNNFMFNYAIGLQNGISPARMFKYQKDAISQYTKMRDIQDKLIREIVDGNKGSTRYEKLVEQIQSLDLYKMHSEGLAMSVLSDITSAPSYSNRMSDKLLKGMMNDVFGKVVSKDKLDSIANIAAEVYLSPTAKSGKFLLDTFTKIDVSGRYGVAKDMMDKGASLEDAVNKSNAIFGDLDKLSPEWVQGISEFGAIPFGNWFYRVSGGLSKNVYDNAGRAIALGVGLYLAEDMLGKRTESYNPLLTILNSPLDMVGMSPLLNLSSVPETLATPALYKKIDIENPERVLVSNSF